MPEVMRWKLKGFIPGIEGVSKALFQPWVVQAEDFDRVTAERDAERLRADVAVADANDAEAAGKKVSEMLATRTAERDAALAEVLRVKQQSALRLIGLANCGMKREALQQRLTAADERVDVLEGLVREVQKSARKQDWASGYPTLFASVDAALKPAQGKP
ncbi:hypothetical protein L9Z73_20855 [Pseudomonas sp. TNT11]|uniref:Uncharacterized protein n=1 Tax=Pseudomonas emilianonis TaxID=2915812 RepID=A0ABT0ELV1_9PSED|nr:hypothetical protein [Pseudomonas emilianonis]MCK1786709.1 hypothetical protein [Pseudomonas emilianonis]